jgi:hypothetical protein
LVLISTHCDSHYHFHSYRKMKQTLPTKGFLAEKKFKIVPLKSSDLISQADQFKNRFGIGPLSGLTSAVKHIWALEEQIARFQSHFFHLRFHKACREKDTKTVNKELNALSKIIDEIPKDDISICSPLINEAKDAFKKFLNTPAYQSDDGPLSIQQAASIIPHRFRCLDFEKRRTIVVALLEAGALPCYYCDYVYPDQYDMFYNMDLVQRGFMRKMFLLLMVKGSPLSRLPRDVMFEIYRFVCPLNK